MRCYTTTSTLLLLVVGLGLASTGASTATFDNATCGVLDGPALFTVDKHSGVDNALPTFAPALGGLVLPVVQDHCPIPTDAYLHLAGKTTDGLDWCLATENKVLTATSPSFMRRVVAWRKKSLDVLICTQTRLQQRACTSATGLTSGGKSQQPRRPTPTATHKTCAPMPLLYFLRRLLRLLAS